jgi:hypothetical protein
MDIDSVTQFKTTSGKVEPADSAVVLYWSPERMPARKVRSVGFTYGLGSVASDSTGRLGLIGAERARPNQEFSVQAVVRNPGPGQTVTLELPPGLALVGGELTQPVPEVPPNSGRPDSTVTWKLRGARPGPYTVKARTSGLTQSRMVWIEVPQNRDFWDR